MHLDSEGQDCTSLSEVRKEAMHALPEIAKSEIPKDGDKQTFTLFVRDEQDRPVYTATITFSGIWVCSNPPE